MPRNFTKELIKIVCVCVCVSVLGGDIRKREFLQNLKIAQTIKE